MPGARPDAGRQAYEDFREYKPADLQATITRIETELQAYIDGLDELPADAELDAFERLAKRLQVARLVLDYKIVGVELAPWEDMPDQLPAFYDFSDNVQEIMGEMLRMWEEVYDGDNPNSYPPTRADFWEQTYDHFPDLPQIGKRAFEMEWKRKVGRNPPTDPKKIVQMIRLFNEQRSEHLNRIMRRQ